MFPWAGWEEGKNLKGKTSREFLLAFLLLPWSLTWFVCIPLTVAMDWLFLFPVPRGCSGFPRGGRGEGEQIKRKRSLEFSLPICLLPCCVIRSVCLPLTVARLSDHCFSHVDFGVFEKEGVSGGFVWRGVFVMKCSVLGLGGPL